MADAPRGRGLLDTSVVIAFEKVDRKRLPPEISISALTLAELTSGPQAAPDELSRARRQQRVQYFEAEIEALPFDSACARSYGPVYAAVAGSGRKPRGARAVDLMIAATAFANRLPLYTLNAKDLRGLEGLVRVVDVSA